MANKMIIDAAHPEETRVVVLRGNRVEEFDFEAANKKQLRGNIYLAKVTRVEPSLQAAFIEYGGNRHGFLAFSEIHPDYYQIPVADRQALLDEEARSHEDEEDDTRSPSANNSGNGNGNGGHRRSRRHRRGDRPASAEKRANPNGESISSDAIGSDLVSSDPTMAADGQDETSLELDGLGQAAGSEDPSAADFLAIQADEPTDSLFQDAEIHAGESQMAVPDQALSETTEGVDHADDAGFDNADRSDEDDSRDDVTTFEHGFEAAHEPAENDQAGHEDRKSDGQHHDPEQNDAEEDGVEQLGGDAMEDVPQRTSRPRRHYKIQEVIKRRQVLLVQVVKEERGNKGAALTTYLSLAGRYSVLMPNTARGGGISRKITDAEDRKRLKAIAQELEVPEGMGIILRTAGAARGMPEVKRDFEYLMRMWETVRETTLKSSAPTLVYEEGSLIKRSIRDLYGKEVDEVIVAGDEGYREAREFMRLLMPTHTKNVIAYRDPQPIFAKSGVEAQLDAMFSNQVVLRSGGYLVINQTEALVAIDVNSGRSTREHNIEDTALRTNLEAADEIARQLRLRDLAGLIVVDFIDMEEGRNDRAVERRIKDALKNDRARIQIGRISHFGLLEMSRQRMRTGVLEGSTVMCPHCAGSGTVRSVSSIALHVLRLLEDSLIKSAAYNLVVRTRPDVALYILNQKRANLLDLEARFGVCINVFSDPLMNGTVYHAIDRGAEATPPQLLSFRPDVSHAASAIDALVQEEDDLDAAAEEFEEVETETGSEAQPVQARDGQTGERSEGEGDGSRRRKRRRRRRGRDNQSQFATSEGEQQGGEAGLDETDGTDEEAGELAFEGRESDDIAVTVDRSTGDHDVENVADFTADPIVAETTTDVSVLSLADADQPVSASIEPATAEPAVLADTVSDEAGTAEAAPVEAPRRRRPRRPTRSAEAATASVTDLDMGSPAASLDAATEPVDEVVAPARRPRRSRARVAEAVTEVSADLSRPSADRDVGADTAEHHPAEATASREQPELPLSNASPTVPAPATPLETVAEAPTPHAAPSEPVATEVEAEVVDPDRPKRSGWWQRAKATFTTGS
ncbi:ribonuclease E/G [Lichenihabitans psoromatis]|uniref:ribonuclease E/G n=1 Tax=Lichenihabitans psoromatis TaxID=2528642 RepID=UPI00103850D1|nr:ribonuclease E/G [Lichenihabitans psoromatis]